MINKPSFNFYRQSESLQFFEDVATLCNKNNVDKLKIGNQSQQLILINQKLQASFKPDLHSQITEQLSELDQRRDNAVICLRKIADGFINHYDAQKQKAGKTIVQVIDKYGSSLSRMNFQAETSTLTNLGRELISKPELSQAVEEITLTGVVEEMIASNNLFNEKYLLRVQETAANNDEVTSKFILEAVAAYRELTDHIEAHSTLTPSKEYLSLISELNELVNRYNTTVNQRINKPETSLN